MRLSYNTDNGTTNEQIKGLEGMKLLIVADDLTGALDTGVQLAKSGASTTVITAGGISARGLDALRSDVVVVDGETRPLPPEEAYRIVYRITRLVADRPEVLLYKKTDSALRGNIGSELSAMLDASGEQTLAFVPAFPQQQRTTVGSVQMLNGEPINQSVFSNDPFNPVASASLPEIIAKQSDIQTVAVRRGEYDTLDFAPRQKTIWLFDASTQEDLETISHMLRRKGRYRVTGGSAGFASTFSSALGLRGHAGGQSIRGMHLAVICGSINPISHEQVIRAQQAGFLRCNLAADVILGERFEAESVVGCVLESRLHGAPIIIDTCDTFSREEKRIYAQRHGIDATRMRTLINTRLGKVTKALCKADSDLLPVLVGGDTLFGFLRQLGSEALTPVKELFPGCVLSMVTWEKKRRPIVSKSGGFGWSELLLELERMTKERYVV